ncbi:hypothetical protein EBR25_01100 [bacterium]|nr:hypothetical protein [bacterium]
MLHWLSWKFDLHEPFRCPKDLPLSSEEMAIGVKKQHSDGLKTLCETMLVEHIQRSEAEIRKRQFNPDEWSVSDFENIEDRIRFELLQSKGVIERWRQGLVATITLANAMESLELGREDYFNATCILPHEFPPLVQRFGLAVIEKSLPDEDPIGSILGEKRSELLVGLALLTEKEKLHPKIMKDSSPHTYSLARELYRRVDWAVKALDPVKIDMTSLRRECYRTYVEAGTDAALQYLSDWRIRPRIAEKMVARLEMGFKDFRGINSNVSSSAFENIFAETMDRLEISYRRQVSYSEFTETKRRFRSDFLLEILETRSSEESILKPTESHRLLCIEITSAMDEFIHDAKYFERLREKKRIVEEAGHLYVEFSEFDDWKGFLEKIAPNIQEPDFLDHVFKKEAEDNERLAQLFERHPNRSDQPTPTKQRDSNRYLWGFIDNPFVITALRRRAR